MGSTSSKAPKREVVEDPAVTAAKAQAEAQRKANEETTLKKRSRAASALETGAGLMADTGKVTLGA